MEATSPSEMYVYNKPTRLHILVTACVTCVKSWEGQSVSTAKTNEGDLVAYHKELNWTGMVATLESCSTASWAVLDTCVSRGIVSPDQLRASVDHHIEAICPALRILSWKLN
jgi:hypothetical protein